ncbi:Histidine protein methyltransferase 1 [Trichoderma ghanense]|uniref:protein-histidine N-methyltransferase n=1 Tax=Trichoderma ghanense TaxID=65468 RepID=A0ABY2HFD4_9HYPO
MAFSFGFSGDDIDPDLTEPQPQLQAEPASQPPSSYSAFPVAGKPQLPATIHPLSSLLAQLPSKIAYDTLAIDLANDIIPNDSSSSYYPSNLSLPRRELWDVRVQLMAEDDDVLSGPSGEDRVDDGGLGKHDVKTGIYEGGFKSWESSIDLVRVLAAQDELTAAQQASSLRVIELGCGTALPSLALFTWIMHRQSLSQWPQTPCSLVLADYNPSVLRLVTMPNFLLAWALHNANDPILADAFGIEGELELSPAIVQAFENFLSSSGIHLSFISGAWSPEFISCLYELPAFSAESPAPRTLMIGAETIYSPFALQAFAQTVFALLDRERASDATAAAYVAAKRLYFGVGGSLDDFIGVARSKGATVTELREESEGVRRGVVHCVLQQ